MKAGQDKSFQDGMRRIRWPQSSHLEMLLMCRPMSNLEKLFWSYLIRRVCMMTRVNPRLTSSRSLKAFFSSVRVPGITMSAGKPLFTRLNLLERLLLRARAAHTNIKIISNIPSITNRALLSHRISSPRSLLPFVRIDLKTYKRGEKWPKPMKRTEKQMRRKAN